MTSPIKPPSKPPVGPAVDEAGGAGPSGKPGGASEAFRQRLDEAEGAAAPRPATAAGQDAVHAIASELRAGRIDAATAIGELVSRALASSGASALPPAKRAELEEFLRRTLADDPTLAGLTKDLERGG